MCAGEELACFGLEQIHFFFRLVGVVALQLDLQAQPLIVIVHPVFRLRTSGILIEQQELSHHVGIVGNAIFLQIVAVERAVHVFHNVRDGIVPLGERVAFRGGCQLVEFFQVLGLLRIVGMRQCNHQVVGVHAS